MRSPSRQRRALLAGALLSLALHALLGLWLSDAPPRDVERVRLTEAVEIELDARSPAPPSSARAPERAPPPAARERREAPIARLPSPPAKPDLPRRPLVLTPSPGVLGLGEQPLPSPSGRTIRPDDPIFDPERLARETAERVGARSQQLVEDAAAESVVRAGAVPAYFADLDARLEKQLGSSPGGKPSELGAAGPARAFVESYLGAAEQYARTGNPGLTPPERTPTTTERLQDRFSNAPESLPLRMMAQAAETKAFLGTRSAQLSLQLALEQDTHGALLSAAIVQSSGNPRFDAFVLEVGKSALASSAPPPQWLLHGTRLRSLWLVEGWLKPPKGLADALAWMPSPFAASDRAAVPVPTDLLLQELAKGRGHFEFRAKLLRAF